MQYYEALEFESWLLCEPLGKVIASSCLSFLICKMEFYRILTVLLRDCEHSAEACKEMMPGTKRALNMFAIILERLPGASGLRARRRLFKPYCAFPLERPAIGNALFC